MPALYALGQHRALQYAAEPLTSEDTVLAFLDDLYILTTKERALEAYETVAAAVREKMEELKEE